MSQNVLGWSTETRHDLMKTLVSVMAGSVTLDLDSRVWALIKVPHTLQRNAMKF